jgi:hypothetical protein
MEMFSIGQIDYPNDTPKGDGPMGCGQRLHIEDFTICGLFSMKLFAIPGGDPPIFNPNVKLCRL